jgi:hypothetical protein
LWSFNGEADEVLLMQFYGQNFMHGKLNFIKYSSMKSVLLEGTFFGYGDPRHSGGCYGLQQWDKCPFMYPLYKKRGLCYVGLAHIHKVWQFEFTCGIYTS